jgi:adenosylcobinamide hydrolase
MTIKGLTAAIKEAPADYDGSFYMHVEAEYPLRTFNTSIWGGGYGYHRHLVNRHVPKSYDSADPRGEMRQYLTACGLQPEEVCGMMTAARLTDGAYAEESRSWTENGMTQTLKTSAWVTAGLGNTARAGSEATMDKLYPGTINIIVAVDGKMSDEAMAGAVITVTEAKAAVLQELKVRVQGTTNQLATGTTTDAVLIAATGRGSRDFVYAGTATILGSMIGQVVYKAALVACTHYLKRFPAMILESCIIENGKDMIRE